MLFGVSQETLLIFLIRRVSDLINGNCIYELLPNVSSFFFLVFRNGAALEYFSFSISNKVNFAMAQQCACILRVVLVDTRTLGTRNSSTSARRSCCCIALFSPWEH